MAGPGDLLVWSFLAFISLACLLRALYLFQHPSAHLADYRKISRYLVWATLATAATLFAVWQYLFLTSDVSYFYVWNHSSVYHSTLWKFEGLWAGQEGSIFLWATAMTGALSINEFMSLRRERAEDERRQSLTGREKRAFKTSKLGDWTAMFVALVIATFAVVLVASDWFRLTPAVVDPLTRSLWPNGFGLSPSLRTELNAIHPPIELSGYALTVMPMAAAFAYLATGDKSWIRYCSFWTRIAWVFLTLGLTIGGLWAYITLGWGGYWAWDPVEVASLLPWIATTALLHTQVMHRRHEMYPLVAPLLAAIAFSLTEFGTFITRSGVWNSVHSFIQSPGVSLGDALGKALASDIRLLVFFAMIFVPLAILGALLYHFLRHHYEEVSFLPPRGENEELVDYVTQDKFTVFAGVLMLVIILLMTSIILVKNAGLALQPQEYETKLAIPALVILFFIVVNYLRRPLGNEKALLVAIVAGFFGIQAYILFPAPPGREYWKLAGAAVPLVVAVLGMGVYRIALALRRGISSTLKARARTVAVILVHVGVGLVVVGYALSNVFVKEDTAILQEGAGGLQAVTDSAFGYTFTLLNVTKDPEAGAADHEYWDKFTAVYRMSTADGKFVRDGLTFIIYKRPTADASPENFAFSNYVAAPVIHTDVFTTPTSDLYIQLNNILPGRTNGSVAVELSVKQIPGVWGIWSGVAAMVGGMVTLMAVEAAATRKGGGKFVPADLPEPPAPAAEKSPAIPSAAPKDAPPADSSPAGK